MKKFFPVVIVALIVILSANCSAGVYDEPIGENVRVSDIGAERFLAAMKDTEIFRNRIHLNFNPLTRAQSFDKPNNGLSAWTSLFYDDQNIGGTLIFYVNGEGYVSGVSMYGYPNNDAGSRVCVAVTLMAMEVIGVSPHEMASKQLEANPIVKDEGGIKIWCEKTKRMIFMMTNPRYTSIFATKW